MMTFERLENMMASVKYRNENTPETRIRNKKVFDTKRHP